jgi:hypothetical protein
MKNPMGNKQDEVNRLKTKSYTIAKKINSNKLSRMDAQIAYKVFYIPAILKARKKMEEFFQWKE